MFRPYLRRLALILVLLSIAVAALAVPEIDIGFGDTRFQRGGTGPLGLNLGLDLQGGVHLVYQAKGDTPTEDQMQGVVRVIETRVNKFGVAEPIVQALGSNRILVQLPGVENVEEAKKLIGDTAKLEFKERTCEDIACTQFTDKDIGLTGDDLERAYTGRHPTTNAPVVFLDFNGNGARLFAETTGRIAGTNNRTAIFLDDEVLLAPVAQKAILGGQAYIEGPTFTLQRVQTLAIQLEAGRLPVPIEVILEQDVDATLGADSLRKSLLAGYAGLGLVILFMALYYRAPGVLATLALVVYVSLLLAIFKLVPVTLTLAGIAGFILSIGMAVDANILIFERMKEELRAGRSLLAAVDTGFNRAWPSIRDSNISTFITCAILFWFGSRLGASMVTGFAVTLFIGVSLSMFSAITVSRNFLRLSAFTGLGRLRWMYSPTANPEKLAVRVGNVSSTKRS